VSLDVREPGGAAAATMTRTPVLAADPWDAPYFGGHVYFSYPPFQHTVAAPAAAAPLTPASRPPVPEPVRPEVAPARLVAHSTADEAASVLAETPTPARRGWLSRLFRRG
jgi:hypothetical protein